MQGLVLRGKKMVRALSTFFAYRIPVHLSLYDQMSPQIKHKILPQVTLHPIG